MPRSRINSRSKDLVKDNGAILLSVVKGEQVHLEVTLNWITNLSGYTITPKIVEADMTGLDTRPIDPTGVDQTRDELPETVRAGGVVTTCAVIDEDTTDNSFKVVIPEDLIDNYAAQPTPQAPVYAWFGMEVADTGVGNNQQIWKPMRGLVEILYSPSEA